MSWSRTERRRDFDEVTRLRLLEEDADEHDRDHADFKSALATVNKLLTGILISVTTAAVIMALQLVIARGAG